MTEKYLKTNNSLGPRLWTRDFILIFLSNLMCFLAFQSMPAVLPVYLDSLGTSPGMVGLTVSVTTLAVVFSRPFSGIGVDKYGRKILYVVGLVLLLATLAPIGLVPLVLFVLVMRFLHGLAWGIASTASATIAADVIPRKRFGEGMGYFSLSASLALAIAPALALVLLGYFEFWLLALCASSLLLLSLVFSQLISYKPIAGRGRGEEREPPSPLPSGTGKGTSSQGESTLSTDKSAEPTDGGAPPARLAATPASSALEASGLRKVFAQAFERSAMLPGLIVFFTNMVYGSVNTFMALTGYEAGVDGIAFFFVVYAIAVMASRPFFGRLVDKRGYRIPLVVGLTATVVAMLSIPFAQSLLAFLAAGVLYGIGQGCALSSLQTMALAHAPYERRGAATSTYFILFDLGIGVGAFTSGILVGLVGYGNMFACVAVLPLVALGIYFACTQKRGKGEV